MCFSVDTPDTTTTTTSAAPTTVSTGASDTVAQEKAAQNKKKQTAFGYAQATQAGTSKQTGTVSSSLKSTLG